MRYRSGVAGKPASRPGNAAVSAIILPFARPIPTVLNITQSERHHAAGWAAHLAATLGGTWWVETHLSDDGEVWLGVVTPSSHGALVGDLSLAWLVSRTADGFELSSVPACTRSGVYPSLGRALAAIEAAEKAPRAIAYGT